MKPLNILNSLFLSDAMIIMFMAVGLRMPSFDDITLHTGAQQAASEITIRREGTLSNEVAPARTWHL